MRFIALLLALIAGMAAAVWYYRQPDVRIIVNEPAARPANRDDRLLDDLFSRTTKDSEEAASEVQRRGTTILPAIRQALRDPGAEPTHRKAALKACGLLGTSAAEAVPEVASLLNEPPFTAEAAVALSFMGSAAVQPLRDAAASDEAVVRREALRSLGKLRERASIDPNIVIPLLIQGLHDPDPSVRSVCVTYLGIVRDEPERAVAGLIEALRDQDAGVRGAAATALAAYGEKAERAIPELTKAAKDPDDDVQREAGRALVRIAELKGQKGRGPQRR